MSAAADRAVYAAIYWARRRDGAAIREVFAGLSDEDHAEAVWLLGNCDLEDVPDDELRARMLGAAAPPDVF